VLYRVNNGKNSQNSFPISVLYASVRDFPPKYFTDNYPTCQYLKTFEKNIDKIGKIV